MCGCDRHAHFRRLYRHAHVCSVTGMSLVCNRASLPLDVVLCSLPRGRCCLTLQNALTKQEITAIHISHSQVISQLQEHMSGVTGCMQLSGFQVPSNIQDAHKLAWKFPQKLADLLQVCGQHECLIMCMSACTHNPQVDSVYECPHAHASLRAHCTSAYACMTEASNLKQGQGECTHASLIIWRFFSMGVSSFSCNEAGMQCPPYRIPNPGGGADHEADRWIY